MIEVVRSAFLAHMRCWHIVEGRTCKVSFANLIFRRLLIVWIGTSCLLCYGARGFPGKWIGWISQLISSTFIIVLLNGESKRWMKCKRRLRQDDPFLLWISSRGSWEGWVSLVWLRGLVLKKNLVIFQACSLWKIHYYLYRQVGECTCCKGNFSCLQKCFRVED